MNSNNTSYDTDQAGSVLDFKSAPCEDEADMCSAPDKELLNSSAHVLSSENNNESFLHDNLTLEPLLRDIIKNPLTVGLQNFEIVKCF